MKTYFLLPVLLLAGCQQNDFSKILYPETTDLRYAQTAYCYKSLTDILCYENPQPQLSNPLKGVQLASASRVADRRNTVLEDATETLYYNLYGEDPRKQPVPITQADYRATTPVVAVAPAEPVYVTAPSDPVMVRPLEPVAVNPNADGPQPLIGGSR
ncbi:MAG: hypothetical protein CMM93_04815 [Rickettsiales bacterium]|nr:hypothetical protein [Rickettsiales bacterium]|tara:strand:- start:330 stop:800 length:471 start_codon:yes stop_codon:yes gene_type:complete